MTERWEYLTVVIQYDGKKHKDWVVSFTDGSTLVGLQVVLRTYGAQGWELIGMIPERLDVSAVFGGWNVDVAMYRATFKRPVSRPEGT